jgi:Ca2+-binding RTX toxin-like protein
MKKTATMLVVIMLGLVVFSGVALAAVRVGGPGPDTLLGTRFNDTLAGKQGPDDLRGFGGNDRLNGGSGRDICRGGFGADVYIDCEIRRDPSQVPQPRPR